MRSERFSLAKALTRTARGVLVALVTVGERPRSAELVDGDRSRRRRNVDAKDLGTERGARFNRRDRQREIEAAAIGADEPNGMRKPRVEIAVIGAPAPLKP